ncbi:hypothetical protein [Halovivax gelatinilyticus]|uniref:hypothetical protein n=1 Tax=Halovivax gelatinilyticus TaxID=2961597 RepID=UPI0020CA5571|nr:hypothetical protein [Halovivax gelatinilyticus]
MIDAVLFVGAFVLAAVATVWLAVVIRRNRRSRPAGVGRLNDRLAEVHGDRASHLERPPRVVRLRTVRKRHANRPTTAANSSENPSTETAIAPVIEVELGSTEPPSTDLAFEFVASVLEAVHPSLSADAPVSHYDVQFRYGPDGLLVSRNCFRVGVPAELADRLLNDDRYRAHDLHRDVKAGDDGTEETVPVLWGECRSY